MFGLNKALAARYDEMYSTAPDVLDKKMRALDARIEEEAFNKANEKVIEAQSAKERALQRKERSMDSLVDRMAQLIIEQNRQMIGSDVADDAINRVKNEKNNENKQEGGTEDNDKETKKRRRKTKTA